MFRITRASAERAGEVAALYVSTRRLAYAPFFPAAVLDAMSVAVETVKWQGRMAEATAETIVALDGGDAIAGFSHISWHSTEHPLTGEVEFMYVGTPHQSAGLGAKLMAKAEAGLASAGMDDAILWVYEHNRAARGFYERCGWGHDGGAKPSDSAEGLFLLRYRKGLK